MSGLVSIITPSYNSEKFISETIESVRQQTYDNFEMIIVDDNSTDNTINIVEQYQKIDFRIKLITLKINGGAGIARNEAIKFASGDFIAFLDSDDIWKQKKLERQISFMQDNQYYFTFTGYETITEDDNNTKSVISVKSEITYKKALYKNPIGCLTAVYNAKALGKFYMPIIRKRQDYALWLKILKKTNAYGLNESLAIYRVRKESISSDKLNLLKYEWKIYREEEGLSTLSSLFYLTTAILTRVIRYII